MAIQGSHDITAVQFFSFFFESLFFGIFLVLYGVALWVRMRRRGDRVRRVVLQVGASTLMLLLAGAHLVVVVARGYEAFVDQGGHRKSAFRYFVDAGKPTFMAKMVIYVTQTLLGDIVMAYRAFIVSGYKSGTIVVPAVLLVATAVTGYGACIEYPRADWSWLSIGHNSGSQWLATFLVLATVSNLFTTTLIILFIHRSSRYARKLGSIPVAARRGVVATIIQSAVLYTVALFFLLVTFIANVNPEMFCIDALTPLIGISFTLIIVITGFRRWGDDERKKDGSFETDGDGSKTRAPRLRSLVTASTKLRLATATIVSAFKPDEGGAHATSRDQIFASEVQQGRLIAVKVLPPLPFAATGEVALDLESGKRGQSNNNF
ncbi:hypothetical protein LXA43DRAFT_1092322 [Ganoderma leucocontextum]|nr:hypothetical protein LXA43DRAFT_1092322 [Ganoderma leucocontextum]